jgi:dATP pyrophosphohydrolase
VKARYDMVTVFALRTTAAGDHELLQLRRAAGDDYLPGTWATIRGKAEGDETAPRAALRELREETGLVPRELYALSSIDSFYTAGFETIWHCPVFAALIDASAQVTLNDEHDAFRWVSIREVPPALMWPRERELLLEIEREILGPGGLAKPHLRIPF